MKWRIKNPAPIGSRLKKWGDYHFGRSLTKYLERFGEEVETDYDPEWDNDKAADVVLVLRGKYPCAVKGDALHIMWNISHPESVPLEEYEAYDLVFIAGESHASNVAKQVSVPVRPLLQCTDTEEFYPPTPENDEQRAGFIFVGNSRNVERPCVPWAIEYGLPLQVWGRMWGKWIDMKRYLVAEYIDNEDLGELYCRSRATLNDHWPDMKQYGFINNRIFDALACGLPIISDYHEVLHHIFPDEILYYSNRSEFNTCLNEILLNYPAIKAKVDGLHDRIQREYSFEARAKSFIDAVTDLKQQRIKLSNSSG